MTLSAELVDRRQSAFDVVAVDQALDSLAAFDSRKAEIIDLVVFGGMTAREAAEVLRISEATLNRELRMARVWLRHQLQSKMA